MASRTSTTLRSKQAQVYVASSGHVPVQVHRRLSAITQSMDLSPADVTTLADDDKVIDRELIDRSFEMTIFPDGEVKANLEQVISDDQINAVAVFPSGARVGQRGTAHFIDGAGTTETAATGQPQELTLTGMQHCSSLYGEITSTVLATGDDVLEMARTQNFAVTVTEGQHAIISVPTAKRGQPIVFWLNIANPGVPNNYALDVVRVMSGARRSLRPVASAGAVQTAESLMFYDPQAGDGYTVHWRIDPAHSAWQGLLQQTTQAQYNVSVFN